MGTEWENLWELSSAVTEKGWMNSGYLLCVPVQVFEPGTLTNSHHKQGIVIRTNKPLSRTHASLRLRTPIGVERFPEPGEVNSVPREARCKWRSFLCLGGCNQNPSRTWRTARRRSLMLNGLLTIALASESRNDLVSPCRE
jgi:hypothetical protein